MIWNPKIETASKNRIQQLQTSLLKKTVKHCYENVPFYRSSFKVHGVKPSNIKGLEDLEKLPFTKKEDLREHNPEFFATNIKPFQFLISTGTTGVSTTTALSRNDIESMKESSARVYMLNGAYEGMRVGITFPMEMFVGGWIAYYGALETGTPFIDISKGETPDKLRLIQRFKLNHLNGVAESLVLLARSAYEEKAPIQPLIDSLTVGGTLLIESKRKMLQDLYNVEHIYDSYSSTEMIASASECRDHCGLHFPADHLILEVIDTETGEKLDEGKRGELVFTTLARDSMPIIRYRTQDLIEGIAWEPCSCGRTSPRILRILGRIGLASKVGKVYVYPADLDSAVFGIPNVKNFQAYNIEEELIIIAETAEEVSEMIAAAVKAKTGLTPKKVVCTSKVKFILDHRGKMLRLIKLSKQETPEELKKLINNH